MYDSLEMHSYNDTTVNEEINHFKSNGLCLPFTDYKIWLSIFTQIINIIDIKKKSDSIKLIQETRDTTLG